MQNALSFLRVRRGFAPYNLRAMAEPATFERRHSNGIITWVWEWAAGWDFGVNSPPRGGEAGVHKARDKYEAQAAADRLAHSSCDERCGEWV